MKGEVPYDDILLEVSKLEVIYNRAVMAIQGVSIKVPKGSIVAILGTNGAGKTTLIRAISGFIPSEYAEITDGTVIFEGEDITSKSPHEIVRRGLVLVPEREKIFTTMTTLENIKSSSLAKKEAIFSLETVYEYFPILKERSSQIAGYLSGGERQMLAIGTALLCQPRLLLIDELSLGLSVQVVSSLIEALKRMKKELGLTILLVEQNAEAALKIADYAYIMETGRVVFDGPPEKLLAHEDVREFYLGIKGGKEKSYKDVKQYRRTRRWWG
ncbi:ABC transporter ATP-binding protein [Candidatus Micrarchaeota archaeon]|nr:MAG: ABC transporter ATP-binding protein [Candidatus Micrarchaeota archaeon]